jgi:glycerophosphoryl diester phosphodiesterase
MRDVSVKALVRLSMFGFAFLGMAAMAFGQNVPVSASAANPYMALMLAARRHAEAHGVKVAPVLSPLDTTLLGEHPAVDVAALHAAGFRVIPWTTDDEAKMHALIALGVDGDITDRPDLLQKVLEEEREAARGDSARLSYLAKFVVSAHRGGRGLRPENTLPSFEDGLDHLATELETDTGVSTDHVSLIWHDQFYNPLSCRKADGSAYTMENRVYLRDISSTEAQRMFLCDKLHQGPAYGAAQFPEQTNDLSLSPVSVAFAKKEGMINPYAPTYVGQLFRFVAFYADYYTKGDGRKVPGAATRAANARTVRFNLETKILPGLPPSMTANEKDPSESLVNHTVGPQVFVDTLCGVIEKYGMVERAEVQSFDFRTLELVEEQHPAIPTYYLTGPPAMLSSPMVPASLRQK